MVTYPTDTATRQDTASVYTVTNSRTGRVTEYKTLRAARKAADRMDSAYGAIICTVGWPA